MENLMSDSDVRHPVPVPSPFHASHDVFPTMWGLGTRIDGLGFKGLACRVQGLGSLALRVVSGSRHCIRRVDTV